MEIEDFPQVAFSHTTIETSGRHPTPSFSVRTISHCWGVSILSCEDDGVSKTGVKPRRQLADRLEKNVHCGKLVDFPAIRSTGDFVASSQNEAGLYGPVMGVGGLQIGRV
jgi:hypothetical protein